MYVEILNGTIAGVALVLSLVAMFYVRHKNEAMAPDNYFEKWDGVPELTELEGRE